MKASLIHYFVMEDKLREILGSWRKCQIDSLKEAKHGDDKAFARGQAAAFEICADTIEKHLKEMEGE